MWQRANIRGLKNDTPYYFESLKGFKEWFKDGRPNISGPINKYGAIFVTNIKYKGGEEILPKNRTQYGVDQSMSYIKTHPDYFEKLVAKRYKLDPSINLENYGKGASAVALDNIDIIFSAN